MIRFLSRFAAPLTVAALMAATPAAQAGVIFSDSFDADSSVSVLNFQAFSNWTVKGGNINNTLHTVDYIRNGGYGINCAGNRCRYRNPIEPAQPTRCSKARKIGDCSPADSNN